MIFRLFADDGLNYHDYELKEIDGAFRIVDVYIYMTGECFSETLKRLYISTLHNNASEAELDAGVDSLYLEALDIIDEMREAVRENRMTDALELYHSIPANYRKEKAFQLAYIQLAKNLDDEIYLEAIESYQLLFPADPSLFLIAMDGYFLKGHYVKALQTIDELEKFVGEDSALNLYRGNLYFSIGDITSSRKCFRKLTEDMPEFELGYLGLLNACIEGYRFDEVIPLLDILQFKFQYEQVHIDRLIREFPDFYTSPHYRDWLMKWQLV